MFVIESWLSSDFRSLLGVTDGSSVDQANMDPQPNPGGSQPPQNSGQQQKSRSDKSRGKSMWQKVNLKDITSASGRTIGKISSNLKGVGSHRSGAEHQRSRVGSQRSEVMSAGVPEVVITDESTDDRYINTM